MPRDLGRYLAEKGAVAVDGVSLTVIAVTDDPDGTAFTSGSFRRPERLPP